MAGRRSFRTPLKQREETTYRYDIIIDRINGPLNVQSPGENGVNNIFILAENRDQLYEWLNQFQGAPIQVVDKRVVLVSPDGAENQEIEQSSIEQSYQTNQEEINKELRSSQDTEAQVQNYEEVPDEAGGVHVSFELKVIKNSVLEPLCTLNKVIFLIGAFLSVATAVFVLFFHYVLNEEG